MAKEKQNVILRKQYNSLTKLVSEEFDALRKYKVL